MGELHILNREVIRALLPFDEAVPVMAEALRSLTRDEIYQHPRVTAEPPNQGGMVLIMPATCGPAERPTFGLKMLTMFPRAGERDLPSVQGLVVLVDGVHGEPLALLDATAITEIRTAAVTAVATDVMATPDAEVLAVIGTGVQGRGHLTALAKVRPWREVRLFSRTRQRAEELAEDAAALGLTVRVAGTAAEALADADVICTTTSACSPVFAAEDVRPAGVHINAVGAFGATCRELPSATVAASRLVVDSRQAALAEAGDVLLPMHEGLIDSTAISAELGEVLVGKAVGRAGDELTVFKSLGLPAEDVVACELVYRKALENGIGDSVAFP